MTRGISENIIEALENPKYIWRTYWGLKKDTGYSMESIMGVIEGLCEAGVVVQTADKHGRSIYTTRKHYKKHETTYNRILSALSGIIR